MPEHEEQTALFAWADLMQTAFPELAFMYAIPNGAKLPYRKTRSGKRYSPEAIRLKKEGLQSGVPDICLPAALGGAFGLYIEMKWGANKLQESQKAYRDYLILAGYRHEVCYGFEAAKEAILNYLKQERTRIYE